MQFLSGHENLKAKLHCFRISDDAWCEICEVDTEKTACVCWCNAMPFAMKSRGVEDLLSTNTGEDRI